MGQINCLYLSLARARDHVPPKFYRNGGIHSEQKSMDEKSIFENFMKKLDRRMQLEGRHIAFLVDNCPAHPFIEMSNVVLIFLLSNTTSALSQWTLAS